MKAFLMNFFIHSVVCLKLLSLLIEKLFVTSVSEFLSCKEDLNYLTRSTEQLSGLVQDMELMIMIPSSFAYNVTSKIFDIVREIALF